jgi:hypothetical protein
MEKLLKRLNDAQVHYVVIGGQAMLQHGVRSGIAIPLPVHAGRGTGRKVDISFYLHTEKQRL